MKKFVSLLLTVALFATMLCVFALPAMAEDTPIEVTPGQHANGNLYIDLNDGKNYILKQDCTLYTLRVKNNSKLTIASGVKVVLVDAFSTADNGLITIQYGAALTVNYSLFSNKGTLNVYGTFDISKCDIAINEGTINYYTDTGSSNVIGLNSLENYGTINDLGPCKHSYNNNGACTICGFLCPHDTWNNGVCTDCNYACKHDINNLCDECINKIVADNETNPDYSASTLSEGSLTVIVGVACSVVFLAVGFFIGTKKKKKPALASGENTDEE